MPRHASARLARGPPAAAPRGPGPGRRRSGSRPASTATKPGPACRRRGGTRSPRRPAPDCPRGLARAVLAAVAVRGVHDDAQGQAHRVQGPSASATSAAVWFGFGPPRRTRCASPFPVLRGTWSAVRPAPRGERVRQARGADRVDRRKTPRQRRPNRTGGAVSSPRWSVFDSRAERGAAVHEQGLHGDVPLGPRPGTGRLRRRHADRRCAPTSRRPGTARRTGHARRCIGPCPPLPHHALHRHAHPAGRVWHLTDRPREWQG